MSLKKREASHTFYRGEKSLYNYKDLFLFFSCVNFEIYKLYNSLSLFRLCNFY